VLHGRRRERERGRGRGEASAKCQVHAPLDGAFSSSSSPHRFLSFTRRPRIPCFCGGGGGGGGCGGLKKGGESETVHIAITLPVYIDAPLHCSLVSSLFLRGCACCCLAAVCRGPHHHSGSRSGGRRCLFHVCTYTSEKHWTGLLYKRVYGTKREREPKKDGGLKGGLKGG
jgi:hypothetical protein